jgi:hypothetical protein
MDSSNATNATNANMLNAFLAKDVYGCKKTTQTQPPPKSFMDYYYTNQGQKVSSKE